jgi:hypothetical protein
MPILNSMQNVILLFVQECNFVDFVPLIEEDLMRHLREETSELELLLGKSLVSLVDGGNSQQNTSSRADSTEEISRDGKSTDAETTEGGSGGDVTVQGLLEGVVVVTVTTNNETLLLQTTSNISGAGAGDIDPGLGEESASAENEGNIDETMDRISEEGRESTGRGDIVSETTSGDELSRVVGVLSPDTENTKDRVSGEALVDQLGDEEEVANESTLKNDGHVGGVEKLDGVRSISTTNTLVLQRNVDTETLEVNDNNEHNDGCEQVGDVGEVLSVEGLLEGASLILTSDQQMEESDNGTLELSSTGSGNSGGREGLPDDLLANVGGDEEGDTRAESVTLLQELIKSHNDNTTKEELDDDEESVDHTEVGNVTVGSRDDIGDTLANSNKHTEH